MARVTCEYDVQLRVTVDTDTGRIIGVDINQDPGTLDLRAPSALVSSVPSFDASKAAFEVLETSEWPEVTWAGG